MKNEELAVIEARTETATPGPWIDQVTDDGYLRVTDNLDAVNGICGFGDMEETDAADHFDAIFIAHTRTDIPALVAEIKRLQAIEQAAQKYITADGPDTYPAYQEFRNLVIASL